MKALLMLKVLLLFAAPKVKSQTSLDSGLIGCYNFSENALDHSGAENHGTVYGAKLTSDRFNTPNSAYDFDGNNDYIELNAGNLQLNQFSYSMWVYPKRLANPGEAMFLISVGSNYGDQHILLGDRYSNSRHTGFSHGSYLGVANNILCSGEQPLTNTWYHLVLTKDETHYTLYVNGEIVCRDAVHNQQAFYGNSTVRAIIGARNNFGQPANAVIDDVLLYNRPLTSSEVEHLYNGVAEIPLTIDLALSHDAPCGGESITISTPSENSVPLIYKWEVDGSPLPNEAGEELLYILPENENPYMISFSVQVSPDNTCFPYMPDSAEKTIGVIPCPDSPEIPPDTIATPEIPFSSFGVPNTFTPNGDGINDKWEVNLTETFSDLTVTVYNRWGEVIFQTDRYNFAWDGTYSGKPAPSGQYVFVIKSGNRVLRSGRLLVLY